MSLRLALFLALSLGALLSGCFGPAAPTPDAESDPVVQADAVPSAARSLALCQGNVWLSDVRAGRLEAMLDTAAAFGSTAIRYAGAGPGLRGEGIEHAATLARALERRGWTGLLGVNGPNREERALGLDELYRGGARWGPFLDTTRVQFGGLIRLKNEVNLGLKALFDSLRLAGVPEAAALAAAQSRADWEAAQVGAFADGVRSTCRTCRVMAGGLGGVELRGQSPGRFSRMWLRTLLPYVQAGRVDPTLDAHIYRAVRFFQRDQTTGAWSLRENYQATLDSLRRDTGWPMNRPLEATELNVVAESFRSPEDAGAAMRALLSTVYGVRGMTNVCPFSIYKGDGWTQIRRDSPVGQAIFDTAPRR